MESHVCCEDGLSDKLAEGSVSVFGVETVILGRAKMDVAKEIVLCY